MDSQHKPVATPDAELHSTADLNADVSAEGPVDPQALRAEITKWQERVPRLAAALRERTEELAAARDEIRDLRKEGANTSSNDTVDARVQARDELIQELEQKLEALREKHRKASGDLHDLTLTSETAQEEAAGYKRKWQDLKAALDSEASARSSAEEAVQAAEHRFAAELAEQQQTLQADLSRAEEELNGLRRRNDQLSETLDMTNTQLATLGDDLTGLMEKSNEDDQLKQKLTQELDETRALVEQQTAGAAQTERELAAQIQALEAEAQQVQSQRVELQLRITELDEEAEGLRQRSADGERKQRALQQELSDRETTIAGLRSEVEQLQHAQRQMASQATANAEAAEQVLDQQLAERDAEVRRLEQCLAEAQASVPRYEKQREVLTQQAEQADQEVGKLRKQLEERSALVRELEQEVNELTHGKRQHDQEQAAQNDALQAAEQRVDTLQQHNTSLEQRMLEQRDLLEDLESELSEQQAEAGQLRKKLHAQEKILLDQENAGLEQQKQYEAEKTSMAQALHEAKAEVVALRAEATAEDTSGEPAEGTQERIMVLEKQLRDRTQELNDLRWRDSQADVPEDKNMVMVLSQQLQDARLEIERLQSATAIEPDDLTVLHGVGAKLAAQLKELGVLRFADIANLDPDALEDVDHPLHSLRARVLKDGWIRQARELCGAHVS